MCALLISLNWSKKIRQNGNFRSECKLKHPPLIAFQSWYKRNCSMEDNVSMLIPIYMYIPVSLNAYRAGSTGKRTIGNLERTPSGSHVCLPIPPTLLRWGKWRMKRGYIGVSIKMLVSVVQTHSSSTAIDFHKQNKNIKGQSIFLDDQYM